MRNILIFAALMVGAGTYMAQTADRMTRGARARQDRDRQGSAGHRRKPASAASASRATPAAISRPKAASTASASTSWSTPAPRVIALNEKSAARFGLRPSRGDYNATVSTANGTIKAARTRLAMVELGGLVVRDVDAMVLPDEALSENLLGLSFLSKLKRFEYAGGKMVLEQ